MTNINVSTDLNELNLPKTCNTEFPDPDDLLNFKLIICPDEGFYRGGKFVFSFKVSFCSLFINIIINLKITFDVFTSRSHSLSQSLITSYGNIVGYRKKITNGLCMQNLEL